MKFSACVVCNIKKTLQSAAFMRARSLMFLLNLFLLRLWLGSRVGPRLSSPGVLVYGASFSICSLVSRSHQIQPQPLVHLLSEREREKKKDWVRYVFLPRRPTSHYRLAARMKPRKFWCAYFSSKHWYLFQAAEGKLKTTVGSSSISFSLSFLFFNSASQTGTESICRAEHTFSNKQ